MNFVAMLQYYSPVWRKLGNPLYRASVSQTYKCDTRPFLHQVLDHVQSLSLQVTEHLVGLLWGEHKPDKEVSCPCQSHPRQHIQYMWQQFSWTQLKFTFDPAFGSTSVQKKLAFRFHWPINVPLNFGYVGCISHPELPELSSPFQISHSMSVEVRVRYIQFYCSVRIKLRENNKHMLRELSCVAGHSGSLWRRSQQIIERAYCSGRTCRPAPRESEELHWRILCKGVELQLLT
jgi:hypothetical protein